MKKVSLVLMLASLMSTSAFAITTTSSSSMTTNGFFTKVEDFFEDVGQDAEIVAEDVLADLKVAFTKIGPVMIELNIVMNDFLTLESQLQPMILTIAANPNLITVLNELLPMEQVIANFISSSSVAAANLNIAKAAATSPSATANNVTAKAVTTKVQSVVTQGQTSASTLKANYASVASQVSTAIQNATAVIAATPATSTAPVTSPTAQ